MGAFKTDSFFSNINVLNKKLSVVLKFDDKRTFYCPFIISNKSLQSDSSSSNYESQKTIFNDNVIRLFLHKCGFLEVSNMKAIQTRL